MQAGFNITHTPFFTASNDSTEPTRSVSGSSHAHADGSKDNCCDLCKKKRQYNLLKEENDYLKWKITGFENDKATLSRALECIHGELREKTQTHEQIEEQFAASQKRVLELEGFEATLTLTRDALKMESRKLVTQLHTARSEHAEDQERFKRTHEATAKLLKEKDGRISEIAAENHSLLTRLKDEKLSGAEAREHAQQLIAKLQRTADKAEADKSRLAEKVASLERELRKGGQSEDLEEHNARLRQATRALASQNDALKDSNEELKRSLNSANERFERVKVWVDDARHQNESLEKERGRVVIKNKALRQDAEMLTDELAKTKMELAGYRKRASRINNQSKEIEHLSRRR